MVHHVFKGGWFLGRIWWLGNRISILAKTRDLPSLYGFLCWLLMCMYLYKYTYIYCKWWIDVLYTIIHELETWKWSCSLIYMAWWKTLQKTSASMFAKCLGVWHRWQLSKQEYNISSEPDTPPKEKWMLYKEILNKTMVPTSICARLTQTLIIYTHLWTSACWVVRAESNLTPSKPPGLEGRQSLRVPCGGACGHGTVDGGGLGRGGGLCQVQLGAGLKRPFFFFSVGVWLLNFDFGGGLFAPSSETWCAFFGDENRESCPFYRLFLKEEATK